MQRQTTNTIKNSRKVTASQGKQKSIRQHIFASLFPIAEHKHTGKRLHHRHTSHGVLLALLFVTGVLLFSNLGVLRVFSITSSGQINIGLTVNGAAPSIGAAITRPTRNTIVKEAILPVEGLCPQSTLVAIYNNGNFAGSTTCTSSDLFQLMIYLKPGFNIIQAQNYDGLNQPGPVTSQISITYQIPNDTSTVEDLPQPQQQKMDTIMTVAPQPSVKPCYEPASIIPTQQNSFGVMVSCVERNVYIGEVFKLPVTIVGGTSPYALSIEWGDDVVDLKSLPSPGQQTLAHTYATQAIKSIKLRLTDSAGTTSYIQTVVVVNGEQAPATNTTSNAINNLQKIWIEAPVPLYIAAVTLTLGFWVGDIFDRLFGSNSQQKKRRHA